MILEYCNKGTVWENGLLRRRQFERDLFLSGGSSTPIDVNITGKIAELQRLANKYCNCGLVIDNIFGSETWSSLSQLPILEKAIGIKGYPVIGI